MAERGRLRREREPVNRRRPRRVAGIPAHIIIPNENPACTARMGTFAPEIGRMT
jgi:hypothetical protein